MVDFLQQWDEKSKRIEEIKTCKDDSCKNEIADFENIIKHLSITTKVFDKTEIEIKRIIPPNSFILQCEEDELKEKYIYYKLLFAEHLLEIINLDHIDMPINYNGFFSYKDKNIISKKIIKLKMRFKISNKQMVDFLQLTSRCIFFAHNRFLEHFIFLSQYLELSYEETLNLYIKYPEIFNFSPGLIQSREERLCRFFQCDNNEIKSMYKKYIPSLNYTPSEINSFLRFNRNRGQETKDRVKKIPWVVQCGSWGSQGDYCGFRTIENLLDIAENFQKNLGTIEKVVSINWDKKNYGVKHLLIRTKKNRLILVCFGVLTQEDKLLVEIFGDSGGELYFIPHISIQFVKNSDYRNLKNYCINSYICYGRGKTGRCLKNGCCIVELKLKWINKILAKPLFLLAEDKVAENMTVVCVLNETLARKHYKFLETTKNNAEFSEGDEFKDFDNLFDDIDLDKIMEDFSSQNEQELEEQEQAEFLEYINYVFGSINSFEGYITNSGLCLD